MDPLSWKAGSSAIWFDYVGMGEDQEMQFDAVLSPTSLDQISALPEEAERIGFVAQWSTETQHDPFLPLALIAENTQRLQMGTAVAI